MQILLLLPLLLTSVLPGQNPRVSNENSSVLVLSFKWSSTRQAVKKQEATGTAPPPEMTAGNKNAARNARANNPLVPDPNEQTIDGRSAAMEKIVQQARTTNPKPIGALAY